MRADFGTWRPNILIVLSLVAWGIGFGWLAVHDPAKWEIATGLYIVGCERLVGVECVDVRLTTGSDCLSDYSHILDSCVRDFPCFPSISLLKLPSFPGLARNTPELRHKAEEYQAGEITREEYDYADTLKRSELSNMAFYIQSLGEIVILATIVGIMFGINVNASTANNNWGLSVLIAFATGVWLLLAIPWFIKEKRRAGQQVSLALYINGKYTD